MNVDVQEGIAGGLCYLDSPSVNLQVSLMRVFDSDVYMANGTVSNLCLIIGMTYL